MKNLFEKYNPIIISLYFLSNILLLFVHGIFWDDWTLNNTSDGIMQQFIGNGGIVFGYIHQFLHSLPNQIFIYRALIFVIGLLNVVLLHSICRRVWGTSFLTFCVCSLFACFPLGICHMTQICLPYQIGLLCQLIVLNAFVKDIRFVTPQRVINIPIILVFQFLASLFLTSAIVVWFGILVAAFISQLIDEEGPLFSRIQRRWKEILKYILCFLPCIAFWVVKGMYMKPTGVYASQAYNEFSLAFVKQYPSNLIASCVDSVKYIVKMPSIFTQSVVYGVCFILFAVLIFFIVRKVKAGETLKKYTLSKSVAFGVLLYVVGISAYLLVGKVQKFNSVEDRHGIFLPFAIIIILSVAICLLKKNNYRSIALSLIASLFVVNSMSQYVSGVKESIKNDYIVNWFANSQLPNGNIKVEGELNPEFVRFYTIAGMYDLATGKQDRCFDYDNKGIYSDPLFLTELYHQRDAHPGPIVAGLLLTEEKQPEYGRLIYKYYTDKNMYLNSLNENFKINVSLK